MKVSAGSSGEDRSIGKGEGHGGELGRAHEVGKRGEDRLTKEDMGSAGVGEDGRRGDRTQQGSMVTVVVVGIVRFQRGEGVRVKREYNQLNPQTLFSCPMEQLFHPYDRRVK